MKNLPIVRYTFYGLVFALAFIVGLFIFPFVYACRKWVRRTKFMPLWIWLNSDEPTEIENDYGDDGFRERKGIVLEGKNWFQLMFISYRWAALRNPHYNLKLVIRPKVGKIEELRIKAYTGSNPDPLKWCDRWNLGKQDLTYRIGGYKYFRYSLCRKINWFGKERLWNVQLGAAYNRWLYKNKISDV